MSDTAHQSPEADKTTGHTGRATTHEVLEPTIEERHACTADAHDWVTKRNDHGDFYETCSHCGKQADWIPQEATPPS
jgi:hypothetical protein